MCLFFVLLFLKRNLARYPLQVVYIVRPPQKTRSDRRSNTISKYVCVVPSKDERKKKKLSIFFFTTRCDPVAIHDARLLRVQTSKKITYCVFNIYIRVTHTHIYHTYAQDTQPISLQCRVYYNCGRQIIIIIS